MGTSRQHHLSIAHASDEHADGPATAAPVAVPKRDLYRVPEARERLSMSRSVIYEQIRSGRLRSVRQGRTRLIPAVAIDEYVSLLLSESEVDYGQPA
jgi:excisionase family DNA binding protein